MSKAKPQSKTEHTATEAVSLFEEVGLWCFSILQGLLVGLVPLLVVKTFFFPFIVPRTGFFMIMVSLLALTWLWLHYLNPKEYRIPWRNPIIVGVGAMLLVWIISGVLGADWTLSFWSTYQRMTGIMMLGYLFVWLLVSVAVLRHSRVWNRILSVFVATGVFVSGYTILGPHGLGWFTNLDISRGGATIGNTSFLGAYVLFTLFVALILLVRRYQKTSKVSAWLVLGVLVMVLSPGVINYQLLLGEQPWGAVLQNPLQLIGEARAVAASIVLGLVVSAGLYMMRLTRSWQKVAGGILSIGPMLAAVVLWIQIFNPTTAAYEAFGELTNWSRYHVWKEALAGFLERPLLGWGPESFDLLHQRFFDPLLMSTYSSGELWFDRAHNIVIDTMVSTGILGVLAYAGVFAGFMYVVFQLRKIGRMSNAESALLGGLMFAYVLQNMTVFDMTVSLVPFFLILAYVAAKLPRDAGVGFDNDSLRPAFRQVLHGGLAALVVVALFAWPIRVMQGSWAVSASFRATTMAERLEHYETAFDVPISRTLFLRTVASRMYETLRNRPELIMPASMSGIQAEAEFLEAALLHEAEARPFNYRAWYHASKMAQLQAFAGRPHRLSDAQAHAQEAVAIAPQNPLAHLSLYELSAMEQDYESARAHLAEALRVAPGSPFVADSYRAAISILGQLETGETPTGTPPTLRF